MAIGIIIHISVGAEKRTEFFSEDRLSIGSDETCDLQIHTKQIEITGRWLELENSDGDFRVTKFDPDLSFAINEKPLRRFIAISDGDILRIERTDISFSFFSLAEKPSLITTTRDQPHIAAFIEEAALDAAATPERDDAKAFLREFTRELMREISITTKLITLVLVAGFLCGILYLGYAVARELRTSREQAEQQSKIIQGLEDKLGEANDQLGSLDKTTKEMLQTASLASKLRVDYGNGICLIVGVYDLIDRKSGKVLRYPDESMYSRAPYDQTITEDGSVDPGAPTSFLTTDGSGSPVEYDFIGTGFHVGNGFVVTNRHVLRPWTEDDNVKQMIKNSNGRAHIKSLLIYFPNSPKPFPLKIVKTSDTEDVAVAKTDPSEFPEGIPALPLDFDADSDSVVTIGKAVVTMGYPNGPDRLLAMVDDNEAKELNRRFGNSRVNLINFLAQSLKIVPLTTQGAITDLDRRRIVHDARTAEGGSGAPLFGQNGKVIGVNFGVFTENTAVNMAIPIGFAIDLLRQSDWKPAEEMLTGSQTQAAANTNPEPAK
jgi:S1-C subfamily serine protease